MRRTAMALAAVLLCGSAVTLSGTAKASTPEDTAIARALELIKENPEAVRSADGDTYEVWRADVTETGSAHVRFARRYRELPVVGGDFVVHIAADGSFGGVSVSLDTPLDVVTDPRLSADAAATVAREALQAREAGEPELIVEAVGGSGRLAWSLPVALETGGADAVVDAADGTVVRVTPYDREVTGTGYGVHNGRVSLDTTYFNDPHLGYGMIDPAHGNVATCLGPIPDSGPVKWSLYRCLVFADSDNLWDDGDPATEAAAVDVHYGTANAWDYFKNVLRRDGFDGRHGTLDSYVTTVPVGYRAQWNTSSKTAVYSAGPNATAWVSLDVVGHELTHAVTQSAIPPTGMIYDSSHPTESSGIEEATSDIFATMAEFYANNPLDQRDYQIGEMLAPGTRAPLRYMYQPSLDGASPDCYRANIGGQHSAAGPANHFFFLLAEGSGATFYGNSPTCNGSSVPGIGRWAAERIWYRALTHYFVADETYYDARAHTLSATAEIYGKCSSQYRTVAAAWAAVGVDVAVPQWLQDCPRWEYLWYPKKPILPPDPLRSVIRVEDWGTVETVEVGVHITHPRRGDLRISLTSPKGESYVLKEADPNDHGGDVTEVFQTKLNGIVEPGEWALEVEDLGKGEIGYLDGWTLLY